MITQPTFAEIKKIAGIKTRKRNWKLWFISFFLASRTQRNYGFICHSYLRWVDDFIDTKSISIVEKRNHLNNQLKLIKEYFSGSNNNFTIIEEGYLFYLIKFSKNERKEFIITALKNILLSMLMDIDRIENHCLFSKRQLEEYLTLLIKYLFDPIYMFLTNQNIPVIQNNYIGVFSWYILALRDFKEDYEAGIINITTEDVKEFKLDLNNLFGDTNFKAWIKSKIMFANDVLKKEILVLRKMPIKVKLFWSPSYFPIIFARNRIKYYDFQITKQKGYAVITEFKIFFVSFLQFIKITLAIFF